MRTLYLTHSAFLDHAVPHGHVERPDRLRVIEEVLAGEDFDALIRSVPEMAPREAIVRVHPEAFIDHLIAQAPAAGLLALDSDTFLSPRSMKAAFLASGAALRAVDAVMTAEADNAFCAHRPPGHHAERATAMGFCFFNHAAIAARHAQAVHGAERVAIFDFDVHHGNGTQEIFWSDPTVLYASTHQMPLYPGTGSLQETGEGGTIVNAPLAAGDGGARFRAAVTERILPALDAFHPDLLILSAGFDAHRLDPLAELNLEAEDFAWVTQKMLEIADRHAKGRLVSLLEGGYDLTGLAHAVEAHVKALLGHA